MKQQAYAKVVELPEVNGFMGRGEKDRGAVKEVAVKGLKT